MLVTAHAIIDEPRLVITEGFGDWGKIGTIDKTNIITQIGRIQDTNYDCIGLTASQMDNLNYPFGKYYLHNLNTMQYIPVKVFNAWGNETKIVITTSIQDKLKLGVDSFVRIEKYIDDDIRLLLSCANDKSNNFGKSWTQSSDYAKAVIIGGIPDKVNGRNEIYLTNMQISYLGIRNNLRPVCGEDNYIELKSISKNSITIINLIINNVSYQVDVHQINPQLQPGHSLHISRTLAINICSHYPLSKGTEVQLYGGIQPDAKFTYSNEDYINLFRTSSLDDLIHRFSHEKDPYQIDIANCLEYIQIHIQEITPLILQKLTNTVEIHIIDFVEFKHVIKAFSSDLNIFKSNSDEYFIISEQELLKQNPIYNPAYVDFLLDANLSNATNSQGDTFLHLMCKLHHGDIEGLIDDHKVDLNIKNNKNQTALHYACQSNNSDFFIDAMDSNIEVNVQDIEGRTPLHYICLSLDLPNIPIMLGHILDHLPNTRESLGIVDIYGKTPLQYLPNSLLKSVKHFNIPKV